MPSLFSRSRTTSTTKKSSTFLSPSDPQYITDDFGRVATRSPSNDFHTTTPPKDSKKKSKERSQTPTTATATATAHFPDHPGRNINNITPVPFPQYADGAFLPLSLEPPPPRGGGGESSHSSKKLPDYGFLSYERHVVLAPEQLSRLLTVVTGELSTRGGITTPFIFSTTALDVSYPSVKRLVRAFLDTCDMRSSPSVAKAEAKWRDEARFAGLHELAVCLRWGLARVVRIRKGQEVRGLIPWENYVRFRETEAVKRYPLGHFQTFLDDLSPTIQSILMTVLTLLTRLTANGTSSGHTPPSLSPLFGPFLFGLGPSPLSFHHTYVHYLHATIAMEHIILAFIRWQDTPRIGPSGSTTASALGVPARLKDWINGYPNSLPFFNDPKKDTAPQPRKGARTIRILNVRRNVRLYSPDLVKTAAQWGSRAVTRPSPGPSNALYASKEWERVAPTMLKLPPRYSEAFKKRMNMPSTFHPDCGPGYETISLASESSTSSYMSTVSSMTSVSSASDKDFLAGLREGEDRFKSLTDLKWGEFETMGFGGIGDDKKLEFDLTESARQERSMKRQTLSWNDFSAAGFSRTETPLSATLQFSSPIVNTVTAWPSQKVEIAKKLKKAQKSLPQFGWDTEPVVFYEEVIEEGFVDIFADLIYGGGWMDNERCEEVDRDSNWALVEFKATHPGTTTTSGLSDPRTSTLMVLFEEFVPVEYRQQLAHSSTNRRRLPSLFSPKSKQWKPAATLNGRPYEVGHVPRSPSYREVEFEGLLQAEHSTKVISATPKPRVVSMASTDVPTTPRSANFTIPPLPSLRPPMPPPPLPLVKGEGQCVSTTDSPSTISAKRTSRFRLPAAMPVPAPSTRRKSVIQPAQYSIVEFETRLASYSDDEFNNTNETESVKQRRRQSKDDAWVDILVGTQARRLGDQDARRRVSLRSTHSDPDLASMEVAQVLAAVKNRSPSPPSMVDRVDRDYYGLDQHVQGLRIDEVEIVPRASDATRSTSYSEHEESGGGNAEEDEAEQEQEQEQEREQEQEQEEEQEQEQVQGGEQRVDGPILQEVVMKAKMKARQGRPGYFDLHPDRRPQNQSFDLEDEIRAKLAKDDSDDEQDFQLPPPAEATAAEVPHVNNASISTVTAMKAPFPIAQEEPQQQTNGYHTPPLGGPQSRTAALIEMYRERERSTTTPGPAKQTVPQVVSIPPAPMVVAPTPTRIPVRPQLKEPSPTSTASTLPAEPTKPQPEVEIPAAPVDDPARSTTPARYVHGAPLHNVLEEEEEED